MNCYDKMNIINLVVLFVFLINVRTITSLCKKNPNCQCFPTIGSDKTKVICNANNNTMFVMEIDPWNTLTITCKNYEGWEDFYFTDRLPGNSLYSLNFEHCGLSDEISLKSVVAQFGVDETNSLIFRSYKNLGVTLKREYLEGFPELKKLILSNNGFTNISKDFFWDCPELEWLDLSQNNLEFSVDIFNATSNLKGINIGHNGMKVIEPGMFDGLEKLEFLSLEGNELTEIKDGIFNHLVSLKTLDLSGNNLSELPQNIFHKLIELEDLDLSFNNLSYVLSDQFKENTKLEKLMMHDSIKNISILPDSLLANLTKLLGVDLSQNGLTALPDNLFWSSKSLKEIVLNDNFFVTLPRDIFKGLGDLEILEINNNMIETLPDRIFEDLEDLIKLDLSRNKMVSITKELFMGLNSLTELNMERNQLKYIDPESLTSIKYLKIAKFSHNQLTLNETGESFSAFHANEFISELDLSYNNISMYYTDWSIMHYHLRLLNLSHNYITYLEPYHYLCLSKINTIDLRYNKLRYISFDHFNEVLSSDESDRDVRVYIDNNPIWCDCKLYDLASYIRKGMSSKAYQLVKFISKDLTCIYPDGTGEIKIIEFKPETYKCYEHDFYNIEPKCQTDCTCWIRPGDNIRIIDCSYKNISEFHFNEEKLYLVKNSRIILNLTGNGLKKIPSINISHLMSVIGLLLSNNNISVITIEELPKSLKILELHNNSISTTNLEVLNYLKKISFEELTLSGNPITCNCFNIKFLNYIQIMRHRHSDLSSVMCYNMDSSVHEMKAIRLCTPYVITTGILAVLCLFITFVANSYYEHNFRRISENDRTTMTDFLIVASIGFVAYVGIWYYELYESTNSFS